MPEPLSDEEIDFIHRTIEPTHDPEDQYGIIHRLIATIRQRTQERDRLAEQFDLEVGRSVLVGRERDREAEAARRLREACVQARDHLAREISGASAIRPVPVGTLTLHAILRDALGADSPEAPHAS
jgi:hypothetical protein